MSMCVVVMKMDGDVDELHAEAVAAMRRALPNLRWASSYQVEGSFDIVDVLELAEDEDIGGARAALESVAGVRAEWLPARPSAMLRAPGGAPGGFGAPGGPPGGFGA